MYKKTIRIFSEVMGYALQSRTKEVKTSTLQDLQELTSLFVHYCKGDVLEDFPGLVDFIIKLNINDKQRGELSKLQHFVGNRMSRDIMMFTPLIGIHIYQFLMSHFCKLRHILNIVILISSGPHSTWKRFNM